MTRRGGKDVSKRSGIREDERQPEMARLASCLMEAFPFGNIGNA